MGSEMCIRDSPTTPRLPPRLPPAALTKPGVEGPARLASAFALGAALNALTAAAPSAAVGASVADALRARIADPNVTAARGDGRGRGVWTRV